MSTHVETPGGGGELSFCRPKFQPATRRYKDDRGTTNNRSDDTSDDVEAILAQGMKDLTFDELQLEQEDLHGVTETSIVENDAYKTEELLLSIQTHLDRIKEGSVYASAEARDPSYVSNRDFRLIFLRCNRYDPKASAEQIIRFFDLKQELFGEASLTRDITSQDLTEQDMDALMNGRVQISNATDRSGRLIVLGFPGLRTDVDIFHEQRALFYLGMDICTSIEDTRKGCIIVSYAVGKFEDKTNGAGFREGMKLSLALPTNLGGYHFCFDKPANAIVAKYAMSLAPPSVRAKTRIHFGSHQECLYLLSSYGIPREAFSFSRDTYEMDLTHHQFWFQQCQQKEQLKHATTTTTTTTTTNKETNNNNNSNNNHVKFLSGLWQGETPTDNDVLCVGRRVNGKGNQRLISLAAFHLEAYDNGNLKKRRVLVDDIMQEIRAAGGRFLKLDTSSSKEQGKGWVQVPDKEMRQKICQTFRNLRYNRRGSLQLKLGNGSVPSGESSSSASAPENGTTTAQAATATTIVDSFTPHDVLFGKMKDHAGNERLRDMVQNSASEYDAGHRGEKLVFVNDIIVRIKKSGGRFLKPLEDGRWEVVSDMDAARKVGSHFRNLRRKHWR
ncbi:unnamed protein product [Cylindrotheca closterium]|uniref:DUF6824 domain-containing protein n=1 Tax=Cylindrotheca closterium TaxID=2856 RepID=A0AAD2FG89_9STRA|nr:unnamed protein product [Cylindrotheca closterium]